MNNSNQKNILKGIKLPSFMYGLLETGQTIFFSFIITGFIYLFVAIPNQVDGASMENTFHDGELLLTNKFIKIISDLGLSDELSYDFQRGDVIIFQKENKSDFIKRIIAGPGDKIRFSDNKVYLNGKQLDEGYLPEDERYITEIPANFLSFVEEDREITVPKDSYFVMGDNRKFSQDSRFKTVGFVYKPEIKGRVFLRYWPPQKFGVVQRGESKEIIK